MYVSGSKLEIGKNVLLLLVFYVEKKTTVFSLKNYILTYFEKNKQLPYQTRVVIT